MATRLSVEKVQKEKLFLDRLPKETRNAFLYCTEHFSFFVNSKWYLAGGTALAIQEGHRQSVDLDFFLPQIEFEEEVLERSLFATGNWNTSFRQEGTIYGALLDAKVSFIAYPFFHPSPKRKSLGYVQILIPKDIAAMKIIAISQRGRKRDFVDLYWNSKNKEPIYDVIIRAIHQYPGQGDNLHHILKSLVYFEDAEEDPMPKIFFDATWKEIKQYFQREIPNITKEFLGLK